MGLNLHADKTADKNSNARITRARNALILTWRATRRDRTGDLLITKQSKDRK